MEWLFILYCAINVWMWRKLFASAYQARIITQRTAAELLGIIVTLLVFAGMFLLSLYYGVRYAITLSV